MGGPLSRSTQQLNVADRVKMGICPCDGPTLTKMRKDIFSATCKAAMPWNLLLCMPYAKYCKFLAGGCQYDESLNEDVNLVYAVHTLYLLTGFIATPIVRHFAGDLSAI